MTDLRTRGLEDLRWQSLTRPERLVVAALLETATGPSHLHLDNVAFELRESAESSVAVPLVLTQQQNRAVSQVLERLADSVEQGAERFAADPAAARTAHYAAGYLRSLLDRLVRGNVADRRSGLDRVLQMLLLDPPERAAGDLASAMVQATEDRLQAAGLGRSMRPVLHAYSEEAALEAQSGRAAHALALDDAALEFEIVDATEERRRLAHAAFDAALLALGAGQAFDEFRAALARGVVPGCEAARDYPDVAGQAVGTALELASSIRRHLEELVDAPWEAVSPGLKSILDAYPTLKRQAALKDFVRVEVRRRFAVRSTS